MFHIFCDNIIICVNWWIPIVELFMIYATVNNLHTAPSAYEFQPFQRCKCWRLYWKTFFAMEFPLSKFLVYSFTSWFLYDTKNVMSSNVSNHNDIWSTRLGRESGFINNITRCRRDDYCIIILWSIVLLLPVRVVWYTVDATIPKTTYSGSAGEGHCSCGGHRAPTTREASSAAAEAVPHRPSKQVELARPGPIESDRPPAGCHCPLVSKYIPEYNIIIIIIIINIHHHCNNAGTLLYSCVSSSLFSRII